MNTEDQATTGSPWLASVARRAGLTVRGVAALLIAVGGVFLAAGASYFLLVPVPLPSPRVLAMACGALGAVFVSAGATGVLSQRGRALFTEPG
jgi:hypothetical protein